MSDGRSAASGAAHRIGSGASRTVRAWRVIGPDRRLAACAAIGIFVTLFLPWYQETLFANGSQKLQSATASITGWGAFSFVEAALLLIAAGVLTLLFRRSEGRGLRLPGGDGWVIMAAGVWSCALIVWRMFDKQGGAVHGQVASTYGIEWGIFVALAVAAFMAYSGARIRAAGRPTGSRSADRTGDGDAERRASERQARRPAERQGRRSPGAAGRAGATGRADTGARPARAGRPRQPRPTNDDGPAFDAPPSWSGDVPRFETHRPSRGSDDDD
ncbi:MAG: hypothetical protein ABSG43_16755 [Solirubrobacteraceae bacterium]